MKSSKIFFILIFSFLLSTILAVGAELPLLPTALIVGGAYLYLSFKVPISGFAFNGWIDLSWEDGTSNMGGLQVTGYYSPVADFANIPLVFENPATLAESVTLDVSVEDFTFLTGKNFLSMYMTMETGEVEDEPQGELDGKSFKHKADFFFPGTKAEALGWAAKVNNAKMVFILIEANGQRRVIGSKAFPAAAQVKINTGKKTGDRKGMVIEVYSFGDTPAPIHDGLIPLTPAA